MGASVSGYLRRLLDWPASRWAWAYLALALFFMLLDQGSKIIIHAFLAPSQEIEILPVFSLILVYNTGAAFSFLSDAGGWQRWLFAAVAIGITLYLLRELWRLNGGQTPWALTYALILGGAWGNLCDRMLLGKVTDFILLHYQNHYFPAFNVADSLISIGLVLWVYLSFVTHQATPDNLSNP